MEDHPKWSIIEQHLAHATCQGIVSISPVPKFHLGAATGRGWTIIVEFHPLPDSLWPQDLTYAVELEMLVHYPHRPPLVRWLSRLPHVQIDQGGEILSPEAFLRVLRWDPEHSTLWNVVQVCQDMLSRPLPVDMHEWSNAEVERLWLSHDPECECTLGSFLTCTAAELLAKPAPLRHAEYDKFRIRLAENGMRLFHNAAEAFTKHQHDLITWQGMSTFPELAAGEWNEAWFDPIFLDALRGGADGIARILSPVAEQVFAFPMFTPEFCARFMTELRAYEASPLPKARPNTMNNYGVILTSLGLGDAFDVFIQRFVQPFVQHFFINITRGHPVDSHHSFVVEYQSGKDVSLDMHTDDSEVTLNVNLCAGFQGSGLTFCGLRGHKDRRKLQCVYEHRLGHAVIHAGRHTHGANELLSGERYNLIVWARSSRYRRMPPLHEVRRELVPDVQCLSRTHDRDYAHWKEHYALAHAGGVSGEDATAAAAAAAAAAVTADGDGDDDGDGQL